MEKASIVKRRIRTTAEYRAYCKDASDVVGESVTSFHEKIGAPEPVSIKEKSLRGESAEEVDNAFEDAVIDMDELAREFGRMSMDSAYSKDKRVLRAKLLTEELGEVLQAMKERNEVELLDGLSDLMYVTQGTAITFDLPLFDGFKEVHSSNMTKHTAKMAVANHIGDKGKGKDYVPPNLSSVLDTYSKEGCSDAKE